MSQTPRCLEESSTSAFGESDIDFGQSEFQCNGSMTIYRTGTLAQDAGLEVAVGQMKRPLHAYIQWPGTNLPLAVGCMRVI